VPLVAKKRGLNVDFSDEGKQELLNYHIKICKQISRLKEAFEERDPLKAKNIIAKEKKYLDMESQYRFRHLERICQKRKESLQTHEVHMELMDLLKQVNIYTGDMARTMFNIFEQESPSAKPHDSSLADVA